jgi:hypothetical protein|tara:strand:+ start:84 stop:443 length:360 start_codon:yes stop_codon:yes gene_type:complete
MDLPKIQEILLSNSQPTQAPPEFMMEIGEYGGVMPRNYLQEAQQMAADTSGIMSMAFPYNKLPLDKLQKMLKTKIFSFKRERNNFQTGGPDERLGAEKVMTNLKKDIEKIQEAIKNKSK